MRLLRDYAPPKLIELQLSNLQQVHCGVTLLIFINQVQGLNLQLKYKDCNPDTDKSVIQMVQTCLVVKWFVWFSNGYLKTLQKIVVSIGHLTAFYVVFVDIYGFVKSLT